MVRLVCVFKKTHIPGKSLTTSNFAEYEFTPKQKIQSTMIDYFHGHETSHFLHVDVHVHVPL